MSASREKIRRKEQVQSTEAAASAEKKGMSKGLKTTLGIVIAVAVVAVVVFFYMLTTGFFASHSTAAVVGEHQLSPAMVNYFYKDSYNATMQQWGELASYMMDTTKPLDEQMFDEENGITWADNFIEGGLNSAAQMYKLCDDAKANGFEMDQDAKDSIDAQIETMEMYAQVYGFSGIDGFLAANYGKGCNEKNYREYLEVNTLARAYSSFVNQSFQYTAEDVAAAYAADPGAFDGVNFYSADFYYSNYMPEHEHEEGEEHTEEEEEANKAAAMEQAKAEAEAMAEAFKAGEDAAQEQGASLNQDAKKNTLVSAKSEWLFDEARVEGDVTCVETESGYSVLYYLGRNTHEQTMPNVRHILFPVSDAGDEEAVAAAVAKAEEALAAYEAGEKTEEAFTKLGEDYMAKGEAAEAALYEDIYPGQMVASFEAWGYDEARQTGDTGIVDTQYGSHVMYFSGRSDKVAKDYLVEMSLRSADFSAWQEDLLADASFEQVASGMKFVTK